MDNSIEKIDIAQRVRDRLRESLADVIPEEMIDAAIKREASIFFNDVRRYSNSNETIPSSSPFSKLVQAELFEIYKEKLGATIAKTAQEMFEAFTPEKLAELIGVARARETLNFEQKLLESMQTSLSWQIQNTITQMKQSGQL